MVEKIDIGHQIERLIQLQDIDSKIYRLNAEKEAKPEEIMQLESSLSQKQTALQKTESELKSLQLKRKEKEIELGTKEAEVKKLQVQLYQIKTNKEYAAMLHEIESHKADNSLLEDEILKFMEGIDAAEAKVQQEREKLKEEAKRVDAGTRAIEAKIREIEAGLEELKDKRAEIAPIIDPGILKGYEKVLEGRKGLALVEVINDACGGCYMQLPPQIINEIKLKEHVVFCENCQRMLYIKDDSV